MNRRLSNEQASGKTNTHLWSLHIIWFFLIHALNKKLYNRGIKKIYYVTLDKVWFIAGTCSCTNLL